jgi:dihydroneopterin aldolase
MSACCRRKAKRPEFVIDVTFYCRRLAATATDLLAQTIDYGQAYHVIRQIVESARFDLIDGWPAPSPTVCSRPIAWPWPSM